MPEDEDGARPSRPWYVEGFGTRYLQLYAHRDDREAGRALALLGASGIELEGLGIMDLACGAGRHLTLLGRMGARATGLDLSPVLLAEATGRGCRPLIRADMRRLPLADQSFDGVLSMFTSFGYFNEDEENWGVLGEIARVLKPTGFLLLDIFSPGFVRKNLQAESERRSGRLRIREQREIRAGRVLKEMRIFEEDGGEIENYRESVRLFEPEDIESAALSRGLALERSWGTYDGVPFEGEKSPRWIGLFRREGS